MHLHTCNFVNNHRVKLYSSVSRNIIIFAQQVNTNGVISFGSGVTSGDPSPFPLVLGTGMICVYWCDIDTGLNNGRVYYRSTTGMLCKVFP